MNVTIFILHYEKDFYTNDCVASVAWRGARVIIIDNGSPAPYMPPDGVEVLRLEENLPLIPAFNHAILRSPSDTYLCLNNDTVAHPKMIERLCAELKDPKVGIVAPGSSDEGTGILHVPYPSEAWGSVDAVNVDNHAWGWRHDFMEKAGMPDSSGHTHRACWASNRDYCYRARQAGYRVVAVRGAYIQHFGGNYDEAADEAGREWLWRKWGAEAVAAWG